MITVEDFLRLPYTPDLTSGGIAYTCRSLPRQYNRSNRLSYDRLRRAVAGVAVELAFRRYLVQEHVPFGIKGTVPFTTPDRYDVLLRGHRCDIRTFLIAHPQQIASIQSNPSLILEAPALVPLDQYVSDGQSPRDLYLFAFLTGLIQSARDEGRRSTSGARPEYLIHTMPTGWARPQAWIPLGPLTLKSDSPRALVLQIGGQNGQREFLTRSMELPPRTRIEVVDDFHSIAYLHVETLPSGRLGVHSPGRRETQIIDQREWSDIWLSGIDIYLAGWMTREEFRGRANLVHEGSRVFQYNRTRTKNLAVRVSDLKPVTELLERARP